MVDLPRIAEGIPPVNAGGQVLAPVKLEERIVSLDVLRGLAVLGILVMNIQMFAMIDAAYFNPTTYLDLSGANYAVWLLSHLFADQKFMTIFSMLFGAGILLMTQRAEARGKSATGLHYRRMFWLIIFGMLHGYLLWHGDILYFYGMCGLLVYLFRKLRPGTLLTLGFLSIAVCSLLYLLFGWMMQFWPPEAIEGMSAGWAPSAEIIAGQEAAMRGGWLEQMGERFWKTLSFETLVFLIWGSWRAGGLMLVGMGLFKLGIFSGKRSQRFYLGLVAAALLVGLPVVFYGVQRQYAMNWDITYGWFFGTQFNYWASILVSLGWVGLVLLCYRAAALAWLTRRLAAVGRMAFSMYIMQTLICTTIFYGHGLGLYGHVERVGQIAIVGAVLLLQLLIAPLWLRYFRFGPLEWLWRSLSYMSLQPLRR